MTQKFCVNDHRPHPTHGHKKMEVFVREGIIGKRFTVICDIDDDVEVLIDRYTSLRGETIDRNVFKYVLTYGGRVRQDSDLLIDLGITHESTVELWIHKRKIEFKTVDYQKLLDLSFYDGWGSTQKPLVPTVHDRVNERLKMTFQDLGDHIRGMPFEALVPLYFAIADDWATALREIYDDSKEINDFIEKVHPSPEERRKEISRLPISNVTDSIARDKKRLLELISGDNNNPRWGKTNDNYIHARGLVYPYDIVSKLMAKEVNEDWEIVHIDKVHPSHRPSVIFKRVM